LEEDPAMPKTLGPEPAAVPPDPDIEACARAEALAAKTLTDHDLAAKRAGELQAEADRIARSRTILQIAMQILGRGGAQRRIATRNLATIETVANGILSRAGVDLKVSIEYGRELQEIATVCGCGKAFPRTATARVCEQCGATRGKKRDEKLYITTSAKSGATEDLAGVAIQLAAARWRRAATGGSWSVVALDEPFGALDAHNRLAMSRTLAALASDGFEQAFVVAHSSDVLEALPHRILITGDGKWSKVEVVR
jgi:ABC-type polar amino acid transport system ATPase subunit